MSRPCPAQEHPDLFDVFCAGAEGCAPRNPATQPPCDEAAVRAAHLKAYGGAAAPAFAAYTDAMRAAAADPARRIVGGYVAPSDFSRWRSALHLPGAFTGSYSRNLNKLWALGSVVLLWDAPYVEFYSPALAHGSTHLAVDACSAAATLRALDARPEAAARLAANAKRVFEDLLCARCLARYLAEVLGAFRRHFDLGRALDAGLRDGAAAKFLRDRTNCSDLDLVHVRSSRPFPEKYGRGLPADHVVFDRLSAADCDALFRAAP